MRAPAIRLFGVLLVLAGTGVFAEDLLTPEQKAEGNANASKEIGHELNNVEGDVNEPVPLKKEPEVSLEDAMKQAGTNAPAAAPAAETNAPAAIPAADTNAPAAAPVPEAAAPAENGPKIARLQVHGDAAVLETAELRMDLEADTVGKSLTDDQVKAIAQKYQDALIKKGYYVARVWAASPPVTDGVLTLTVDEGRMGKVSLYKREGGKTVPYKGRWFTEQQLQRRLAGLKQGEPFNYSELYGTVYAFNSHPDLTADVDLTVRKAGEGDDQRRYVDMDFEVKENFPLHATIEFDNTGTDLTQEWRTGLTLQYLNLTKHDDVLTLSAPASLDLSTVRSTALSYYLPHNWRKGGNFSLFGGLSYLDTKDVVPGVDLKGNGWFGGAQWSYNFINNERRLLNASFGISHSTIEDHLIVGGVDGASSKTTLTPLALTLSYAGKQPDKRGGRTTTSLTTEFNRGGFLGASDDAELQSQRENAKADFIIEKFQIARVQPVLRNKTDPKQNWILYTRVAGQYATEPLIPAEEMGAGGQNTVRGYLENEVLADDGMVGNVELRTPIHRSTKIPRWLGKAMNEKKYEDYEGLQFVLFTDGAYLKSKDTIQGQADTFKLLSVGPGLRYSIGNGFQARLDWGFPLATTDQSDTTGRGNVSVQFLF